MRAGIEKIGDFQPTSRRISETVRHGPSRGSPENAGLENGGPKKSRGWKMQDWKMTDEGQRHRRRQASKWTFLFNSLNSLKQSK